MASGWSASRHGSSGRRRCVRSAVLPAACSGPPALRGPLLHLGTPGAGRRRLLVPRAGPRGHAAYDTAVRHVVATGRQMPSAAPSWAPDCPPCWAQAGLAGTPSRPLPRHSACELLKRGCPVVACRSGTRSSTTACTTTPPRPAACRACWKRTRSTCSSTPAPPGALRSVSQVPL